MASTSTMFERAGGEPFFEELTRRFYAAVDSDPVLRPVYPEGPEAFEESRQHLRDFLIQFWGGPDIHRQRRGAANLKGRHAHLRIGQAERDAWVRHMTDAIRAGGLSPLDEGQMVNRMAGAATQLINDPPWPS